MYSAWRGPVERMGATSERCLDAAMRIHAIVEDRSALLEIAAAAVDPRFGSEVWPDILAAELLELAGWSLRHVLKDEPAPMLARQGLEATPRVLTLLPRYGFALHALRRAVPFSLLGFSTTCSFAPAAREQGEHAVRVIAEVLDLPDLLENLSAAPSRLEVSGAAEFGLVVVTGRRATVDLLRQKLGVETVVGAVGRCAVEIYGRDQSIGPALAPIMPSCTRVRVRLRSHEGRWCSGRGTWDPRDVLARLHPALVADWTLSESGWLHGYRCVQPQAGPSSVGLGADPIYGWPGDYCF